MRINTVGYYIKQGTKSLVRNKMMSIASITTVMASMLILGVFFITMANVNFMVKNVEEGVEIKVFLKGTVTPSQMANIESEVKSLEGVSDIKYESKQQALDNFKAQLGENADLVEGIEADKVMPCSYIIKMQGPKFVDNVVQKLKSMDGIDKINDARPIMDKLIQVTNFIKTLGISLMAILLCVSIFLISNTIKLTVIARKREIGIMKYIGATDWFIRWPFIIEGILLGLIGSVISAGVLAYGYNIVIDLVVKNSVIVTILKPSDIIPLMSVCFLLLGLLIGAIGSTLSVRKFLRV